MRDNSTASLNAARNVCRTIAATTTTTGTISTRQPTSSVVAFVAVRDERVSREWGVREECIDMRELRMHDMFLLLLLFIFIHN